MSSVKTLLIGRPMSTMRLQHERLSKTVGLAVFASDNLSSSAYATEEMLLVLVLAGTVGLSYSIPITLVIAAVFAIIVFSYRQTIHAYPNGGGAYTVAHENLGRYPGLIAASSLLIDYVLTVAVSVAAGVAAVVSAVPWLDPHRAIVSIGVVVVVSVLNLRGVRESGRIFAVPTYAFLFFAGSMLVWGLVRVLLLGHQPPPSPALTQVEPVTAFLLLRAFSHGCTAVTGVEAISNGVPAFRRPESVNAAQTLTIMGAVLVALFCGITILARIYGITGPDEEHHLTVVASLAQRVFGPGVMFVLVQASTAMILFLAANTSYADFPRLSATLAKDRFAPRQLMNRGDRLAFSNGVAALAVLSSILLIAFDADVTRLIQLYLVGVFTSLTLSQWGMVQHWLVLRGRERHAAKYIGVNGLGAVATGVVLAIVLLTRFREGAWIVVCGIPVLVAWLDKVNRHYRDVGVRLRDPARRPQAARGHVVAMLVGQPSDEERRALTYIRLVRPDSLQCVHFGPLASAGQVLRPWAERMPEATSLDIVPHEGRLDVAVRKYITELRSRSPDGAFVTVVIPERFSTGPARLLRNRPLFMVKAAMLFTSDVIVTDVPFIEGSADPFGSADLRHEAIVMVSAVHNATMTALEYARRMDNTRVSAVHVEIEPEDTARVLRDWDAWSPGLPLAVVPSPYRSLARSMVDHVRTLTADGRTVVTILIPEFVLERWWHQLLHNQSALALKRAFLLEPNVVVTSIPYPVGRRHHRARR